MRISTRGRYAIRMMIEFAMHPNIPTKIIQVSTNQGISEKYLEQIVSTLTKAGYVKGIRGALGGYILAKSPEEYTVGDILRVTEGSLAPVFCLDDGSEPCEKDNVCVTRKLFKKIEDAINQVVDNITLEDLLNEELQNLEKAKNKKSACISNKIK